MGHGRTERSRWQPPRKDHLVPHAVVCSVLLLLMFGCASDRGGNRDTAMQPGALGTSGALGTDRPLTLMDVQAAELHSVWRKAQSEHQRRDAIIIMMDRRFLSHGRDLRLLRHIFEEDFRLIQRDSDGTGWGLVYCTPKDRQDVVGWWRSAWYLYVRFRWFPNGEEVVDKVWITNWQAP